MTQAIQKTLPDDMVAARKLPGIQPVQGTWLRIDDAYAGQMARRRALLDTQRQEVLWMDHAAQEPAQELLDHVIDLLPGLGFVVETRTITCPDSTKISIDRADPLGTLGRAVQCDFCLLQKQDDEHVLQGAVLCFPASWRLADKAGRPLVEIHDEVADYDDNIARRVQRLFDGVQPGRPIWRFNQLWYDDPQLFQPRSVQMPRRVIPNQQDASYFRAERQTIFKLPISGWAVFAIHTYVVRAENVPSDTGLKA